VWTDSCRRHAAHREIEFPSYGQGNFDAEFPGLDDVAWDWD